MNLDETREEIQKVKAAMVDGIQRLQRHELVELTSKGCVPHRVGQLSRDLYAAVREIESTEINSAMAVMDLLRTIATTLDSWAPAPGEGLTIAVAVLRMAADHAELGATMTTAEIIVGNITDFVSEVIAA